MYFDFRSEESRILCKLCDYFELKNSKDKSRFVEIKLGFIDIFWRISGLIFKAIVRDSCI